jgi:hypothetical protein
MWHIASFRCAAELGRYPGIADMAGLAIAATRSRLTQSGLCANARNGRHCRHDLRLWTVAAPDVAHWLKTRRVFSFIGKKLSMRISCKVAS